jgi:hypothetical protein
VLTPQTHIQTYMHVMEENNIQTKPPHDPESPIWYMDPRVWIVLFGLLCWIATAVFDIGTSAATHP